MKKRCHWVKDEPLYIHYHDQEWGRPEYDSKKLFELLCLEGQQAGLSWWTVLQKRESYRQAFYDFDPHRIAELSPADIEKLSQNKTLIRHRKKLASIVKNAQAYLALEEDQSFSDYIWSYVNGQVVKNEPQQPAEILSQSPLSQKMSRDLKKRGFSFVGPVICYAFMQAAGLVNDHESDCFLS